MTKAPKAPAMTTCVEQTALRIFRKFKGRDFEIAKEVVQIILDEQMKASRRIQTKTKDKEKPGV